MFAVLAIALAVAPATPAYSECLISPDAISQPVPRFASFPAVTEQRFHPAPVDVRSDSKARTHRSVLSAGAKAGPNFAGQFTVVSWGCGSACVQWAVVDGTSGKVHFEPTIDTVDASNVDPDASGGELLEFRRNSRLLIVTGAPHEDAAREGVGFYQWNGKSFNLLTFVPRAKACKPR